MTVAEAPLTLAVHTLDGDRRQALIDDVRRGLRAEQKWLSPRWFYDERGSALFDAITELPEYYQTRTEFAMLSDHAGDIVAATRPSTIVEVGAGSCSKSRLLLQAARDAGTLRRFVPFDVSDVALQHAARLLVEEFPGLRVYAVVGDFQQHLRLVPHFQRQLVVFLGSTIGNLDEEQRSEFLAGVRSLLRDDDAFLLGVDLVKPAAELESAYNDSMGLTDSFNHNVLAVINAELGADFELSAFEHVARYEKDRQRIEMRLRATRPMVVTIPGADGLRVELAAGEDILTEISVKFTREGVERELKKAGMTVSQWYTDSREWFGLALAVVGD
ncbi:MAG TPA: L-histidine N(alpha)-methyltransferase [Candidatus Sulfotelmatobacter sp.]|nr:L-histidine N(alpha)-methyltransferase [Candidatus Sulfotelmatobacter sp.]